MNDGGCSGLEVLSRAFCCKARGGGGRVRQATVGVRKVKKGERSGRYKYIVILFIVSMFYILTY
jgi:hypothetical protein